MAASLNKEYAPIVGVDDFVKSAPGPHMVYCHNRAPPPRGAQTADRMLIPRTYRAPCVAQVGACLCAGRLVQGAGRGARRLGAAPLQPPHSPSPLSPAKDRYWDASP